MKIVHYVNYTLPEKSQLHQSIRELGVEYQETKMLGEGALISFEISESDSRWTVIFDFLKKHLGFDIYRGNDQFYTVFSEEEIRNAEWLCLRPDFMQGYPQPENSWMQKSLINVCPQCGIYEQERPLRIKKEPKLGKNAFLSLFLLYELLAVPEVFSALEEMGATGYEAWDVILHRTSQASIKVRQFYIPEASRPGLVGPETMRQVKCNTCGMTKYYPHRMGPLRLLKEAINPSLDFTKTNEWFGYGFSASREMLVSNRIAQLILDRGWQKVCFYVVELV